MDSKSLGSFKERLETQLNEVIGKLKEHERVLNQPPSTRDFAGGDRAQELDNKEAESAIVQSEENLIHKIEHALERIKDGSYGICEGCQCEIPLARLEAKPSVSLCVACQEKHEAE